MAAACGGASRWGALVRGRLLRRSRNSAGYSTALTAAGGRGKGTAGEARPSLPGGKARRSEGQLRGCRFRWGGAKGEGAGHSRFSGSPTAAGALASALVQRGRSSQNDKYRRETANPRTEKMEVDQDWTSVYPVAAAFKPSCVPLPLRMGYPVKRGVPPVKEGNLELLKIPNFLHLTPVAIRKHCAALKDFCTEWPADVDNDEKCMQHFPIEVDTVDYISAGPSVRNPKARVVTLTVKLSSLNLDDHAKKKLIKLVGERYCEGTDTLTITTDRCPLRRQNYDYGVYLLTVLFHESWKTEEWEKEKTEADMEEYIWENSASEKNALETLVRIRAGDKTEEVSRQELLASQEILAYRKSVVELKNEGETDKNLSEYKNSVKRLLNMSELQ